MTALNPNFEKLENIPEQSVQELKTQFLTITSGNLVPSQRYQDLITAITTGAQELEDATIDGMESCSLLAAVGEALNRLGAIAGEARSGITGIDVLDGQYHQNIAFRKRLNLACGIWDDFIVACEYLESNSLITGSYISESPMTMHIILYGISVDMTEFTKTAIRELFRLVKCAEVTLDVTYVVGDAVFGWDDDPDPNVAGFGVGTFTSVI